MIHIIAIGNLQPLGTLTPRHPVSQMGKWRTSEVSPPSHTGCVWAEAALRTLVNCSFLYPSPPPPLGLGASISPLSSKGLRTPEGSSLGQRLEE